MILFVGGAPPDQIPLRRLTPSWTSTRATCDCLLPFVHPPLSQVCLCPFVSCSFRAKYSGKTLFVSWNALRGFVFDYPKDDEPCIELNQMDLPEKKAKAVHAGLFDGLCLFSSPSEDTWAAAYPVDHGIFGFARSLGL